MSYIKLSITASSSTQHHCRLRSKSSLSRNCIILQASNNSINQSAVRSTACSSHNQNSFIQTDCLSDVCTSFECIDVHMVTIKLYHYTSCLIAIYHINQTIDQYTQTNLSCLIRLHCIILNKSSINRLSLCRFNFSPDDATSETTNHVSYTYNLGNPITSYFQRL